MLKRVGAIALAMSLLPSVGFAQTLAGPLKKAPIPKADSQRPASKPENPYKTTSYVLMGGGATVLIVALAHPVLDASCDDFGSSNYQCGTHAYRPFLFGGLAAVGIGAFLLAKGAPSPDIAVGPHSFAIGKRIRF